LTSIVVDPQNKKYDSRENCNAIIETESNKLVCVSQNTVIPASVTEVYEDAIREICKLSCITVAEGNKKYDSRNNCNAVIETATNTLIAGTSATVIPDTVTGIGKEAFYGCTGLINLVIPASVEEISSEAFKYCTALESIVVDANNKKYSSPDNCNAIMEGGKLILGCANTVFPPKMKSIEDYAFFECQGLTEMVIPEKVSSIGEYAFYGCKNLKSITLPQSLKKIQTYAFGECDSLTSLTIPEGVTAIGEDAFYECYAITELTVFAKMKVLKLDLFSDCPLEILTIGPNIGKIKEPVRYMDGTLKAIRVPASKIDEFRENLSPRYKGLLEELN
jgi:hypothetical protein